MKTYDKRHFSIRNKLFAAIAMLLVSSIMMVSSTYAWFTLSTAPEVQGITTTVGANGNLEIALMPYNGDASLIGSAIGDSTIADNYLKNMTWGNLLDLNDTDYALNTIKLLPARLNIIGGAVGTEPLKTPVYGADGRISSLDANTAIGARPVTVDQGAFTFGEGWEVKADGIGGVRAIGTSSSLTEYAQAFNSNLAKMSSLMGAAQDAAEASLSNNGATLADMAIEHMNDTAGTKTYEAYLPALNNVLAELQAANDSLEKAILAGLMATASSSQSTLDIYNLAKGIIVEDADLADVWGQIKDVNNAIETDGNPLYEAYKTWTSVNSKLAASREALTNAGTAPAWGQVSGALNNLMNTDGIKFNGKTLSEFKNLVKWGTELDERPDDCPDDATWEEAKSFVSGCAAGITLALDKNSGVYGELAESVGDINAAVVLPKLQYGGMGLANVKATIKTDAEPTAGAYLKQVRQLMTGLGAFSPAGGAATSTMLNVTYGYIVDFLFRTNASSSNLQLQTDAANRVYEDGSQATMGHGSSMTFTTTEDLDIVAVKGLMEAIRVVFMDYETQEIYGIGKLDANAATQTDVSGQTEVTAKLYLYDFENATVDPITGKTTMDTKLTDATLCALPANTAKAVSALVYMDGDYVDNSMVANGETSIVGSLNLQFASSAELKPMANSALENMTESTNP